LTISAARLTNGGIERRLRCAGAYHDWRKQRSSREELVMRPA